MRRLIVLLLGALLLAQPASAATQRLQLSSDGVHWGSSLTKPLFDGSVKWVPGDQRSAIFYARNNTGVVGTLAMSLSSGVTTDLLDSGDLQVEARIGDGPWSQLRTSTSARGLAFALLPGKASRQVTVRAMFAPTAGNTSQRRRLDLSFALVLEQSEVAGPSQTPQTGPLVGLGDGSGGTSAGQGAGSAAGPQSTGGLLPSTGSVVRLSELVLALLLIVSGAFLTVVSRRRDSSHPAKGPHHA